MRLAISSLLGAVAAATCVAMAFDLSHRVYAYASLGAFLIFVALQQIKNLRSHTFTLGSRRATLLLFLCIIWIKDIFITHSDGLFNAASLASLSNFLFFGATLLALNRATASNFVEVWSRSLFLVGCILAVASTLGVEHGVHENFPSALMLPFCLWCIHTVPHRHIHTTVVVIATLVFSFLLEARTTLGALFCGMLLQILSHHLRTKAIRVLVITTLLGLISVNFMLAVSATETVNYWLTNRPVIWNYYVTAAVDSPLLGSGPVSETVSNEAAERYQDYIQRGVAERYGPQSMYIKYFFESGVLGIITFLLAIAFFAGRTDFGSKLTTVYLAVSLGESTLIGSPSIYGMPLTIGIASCFLIPHQPYSRSHIISTPKEPKPTKRLNTSARQIQ